MADGGYWMLDTARLRSWGAMADGGYWMLDTGDWMLVTGCLMLHFDYA